MNYLQARQIIDGPMKGRWHFSSANRRSGTYPVGYCSRYRDCPKGCGALPGEEGCDACEGGVVKLSEAEYHAHAHATEMEARECYREYTLDKTTFRDPPENPSQLHRCRVAGCGEYTAGYAQVGGTQLLMLCEAHRNRESLEPLVPVVGQVWTS